ncbi:MAG: hypothetical protein MZV70_19670 [Desulfobacterales bacterium]|nr:hypothetical protein [Desulfobacterales bacterium]
MDAPWLDHQWGSYGTLRTGILDGRDWLGINIEGGLDPHRRGPSWTWSARSPCRASPSSSSRDASLTGCQTFTSLQLEWRSAASMVDYPIGWHIAVPEIDAEFEFRPSVQDQEIPVFGLVNAIWEGAGQVEGTIAGRAVAGRARLELHGYGHLLISRAFSTVDRQESTARSSRSSRRASIKSA